MSYKKSYAIFFIWFMFIKQNGLYPITKEILTKNWAKLKNIENSYLLDNALGQNGAWLFWPM